MKASTPIVDAVKRQHAEDDARALTAARARVSRAWEACPHWDYETDGEPSAGHECCREVIAARAEVQRLKRGMK